MRFFERWHKQVEQRHHADRDLERQLGIPSNTPKAVSPADIERLEEQHVPWLRKKRQRQR